MKTIDTLQREHEWIGWMAECLESLLVRARREARLPAEAYDLLSLYESFADGRHQDKEEQVLFRELLSAADDRDRQVLERLLREHEAERQHMAAMRANALGAVNAEPHSLVEFDRAASEYLALHHAHMRREATVLFPMAARLLDADADERMLREFRRIEGGATDPHALREQILTLRHRVGLPHPPAA